MRDERRENGDGTGDEFDDSLASLVCEPGQDYHDLRVWQGGIELVSEIYRLSGAFPDSEKFGLTNQMRRAAVSIPSNIAEGSARSSGKDYSRFLEMAVGSLSELETQAIISRNLGFIGDSEADAVIAWIRKLWTQVMALRDTIRIRSGLI